MPALLGILTRTRSRSLGLGQLFIWVFPDSEFLFTVCYCAAHGPLAFSVATWRNSLVFHSLEKMTSLFIHLYPPFVFTTMVHFMPHDTAVQKFPALGGLRTLNGYTAFWFVSTLTLTSTQPTSGRAGVQRALGDGDERR